MGLLNGAFKVYLISSGYHELNVWLTKDQNDKRW